MDIRKPKAAHSIREFAIEIGTIIIGILLALSFEAGVETLHHHALVTHAKTDLRRELLDNRKELIEANASQRHLIHVLGLLLKQMRARAAQAAGNHATPALSVKTATMAFAAWDSTVATQALTYMPFDQAHALAMAYSMGRVYNELQADARKPLFELSASGIESVESLDRQQLRDAEHIAELNRSYLSTSVLTGEELVATLDQALKTIG